MKSNGVVEVITHNGRYKKRYVDRSDLIESPLWFHKKNLMQTSTGFGKNLKTEYKIKHGTRLCRVYYSNFSNSGIFYLKTKEGNIILDITW